MISFQNLYEEVQEQVQDDSATSLILIKRAINQGAKKFGAILNREWRNAETTFNIVADQQYYQVPEDCIRIKSIVVTVGGIAYNLQEIVNEDVWRELNQTTDESDVPEYFFVKGDDRIGIFPIPSSNISNGASIYYEPRMRDMSQANYTTGTVAVTNNSAAITGSSTTFTAVMVGRYLKVDEPNGDGMWYKISAYTSATSITLDNTYSGSTASGLSYTIAEMPDIPEEFHESLIDYACYRYYRRRRDIGMSRDMKAAFDEALAECQATYSSKTSGTYVRAVRPRFGYVHKKRDYTVS